MKTLEHDAWRGLCGALARLVHLAQRGGATKADLHADDEVAVLDVAFDGTVKSPLFIDVDRRSGSFCAAFGRAAQVSDYAADIDWLLALADAVSKGGWREECVTFGGRTYSSRAELPIKGQTSVFSGNDLWALRLRRPERETVVYAPWADQEINPHSA